MSETTPMLRQYFEIKENYQDYILFYRLGDFYEMFYDDAIIASKVLDITLTKRNAGGGKKAPLCGVPYHSADQYMAKLIEKGYKVAVCEQVEDPATAKGIVKREVVRMLTPGTVSDPHMLNEGTNNFLMSIGEDQNNYVIAYADISTGLLKYRVFDVYDDENLLSAIYIIRPSEIIIKENFKMLDKLDSFIKASNFNITITKQLRNSNSVSFQLETIKSFFAISTLGGFGIDEESRASVDAIARLIEYLKVTQKTGLAHIKKIVFDSDDDFMHIDAFTMRNLELTENMSRGSVKGSLLNVLDRTKTALGKRKLKSYILSPLLNKAKINNRLDRTEFLLDELFIRSRLTQLLDEVYDIERITTKLVLKTINPRDIIALKNSFMVLPDIKQLFAENDNPFADLFANFNDLKDICNYLEIAVKDDPPISVRMGKFIKDGFSQDLDRLRSISDNSEALLDNLLEREREKTGIKNLKLGFNKVFGYYLEVTNAQKDNVPDEYIRKQTLRNCERYIHPELKKLEDEILSAKEKINMLEYQLYLQIVQRLNDNLDDILKSAEVIAELDVMQSFAATSDKYSYIRPTISEDNSIKLSGSRHPVVESMLGYNEFVPNDVYLDSDSSIVNIITGPNMAGKSTYLRQTAVIALMMQIGCFVPCDKAEISISDRIFTRVGASDDLYRAQSTFMVEMLELANILNHATDKSLVILDEIGRGTSTFDGLSLAWALTEHIATKIKAKTLFATHYHELTELENTLSSVVNYRITASEKDDDIVFLRKLVRGAASKSFGIEVAKLAGVPNDVLIRARVILKELEENDIAKPVTITGQSYNEVESSVSNQVDEELVRKSQMYEAVNSYLSDISLNNTSPINALVHLEKLKNMMKGE